MSLLLDALRKAEKVKGARASGKSGEPTDLPLLVEEARTAEANGHGLVLVDMVDAGAQPELTMGPGEARSIFDLNGESATRRRWRWGFISTGLALIVVLSVYYGWLLYMAVKPSAGLVPRQPPLAAMTPLAPAPPVSVEPAEPRAAEFTESPLLAAPSVALASSPEAGELAAGMEGPAPGEIDFANETPVTRTVTKTPPVSVLSHAEAAAPGTVAAAEMPTTTNAASTETGPTRPVFSITRGRRRDPVFPRLASAYQAYRAGDHAQAEVDYRFVLAREPDNRDALLGIAALAVSKDRLDEAIGLYRRVLQISPNDRAALAALASIREDRDPRESESRLKRLLATDPDAPYLHFALGNLYAAQGRWSEAQQAFFDAYRHDSENGDYAYNLAVGLDHLGQRRVALRYYRQALEAAEREDVGFEPEAVRLRVQILSERPAVSVP